MRKKLYRQRYTDDDLKNRKRCPACGKWQNYSTFVQLKAAKRKNTKCHSCANSNPSEETLKKMLRGRKKYWTKERRLEHSRRTKLRIQKYTLVELIEIRHKQSQCQRIAFAKRKKECPEWYASWRRKMKTAFKKYRGENHWVKRPEVLQKIKDSCAIYQNGGHWFHTSPASLKKLKNTINKKKMNVSGK